MAGSLVGRIGVITGASAGIGEALTRRLSTEGVRLVINARREDRLGVLRDELGADRVAVVPGDAADDGVIEALLDGARKSFGREADLVVANAGLGLRGSVYDSDTSRWEDMIRLNLLGAARLMREGAARLVSHQPGELGSDWSSSPARDLVVLGSNVGRHISPFSSMYGSTKFGVGSLAEALRRELAPRGVRVTLIEPGVVRSEFQESAGYDMQTFGEFMERIGPVLDPDDVARTIAFVVSQPTHVHVNDVVVRPTRQDYP